MRKKLLAQHIDFLVPHLPETHLSTSPGGKNMCFNNNNNNDLFQTQSVHIQKTGKQNWYQKEYTSADIIRKQIKYIG